MSYKGFVRNTRAKLSHFGEVLHSKLLGFVPRKLNPNTTNSNKLPIVLTGTLKLQDWILTDEFAGVDIAGLDNEGLDVDGLDNDGRMCGQLTEPAS